MIVNPVFKKSCKGLNSILKNETKTDQTYRKQLYKKPKLQTCLKGGKIAERASKRHAKLNNLSVFSDK